MKSQDKIGTDIGLVAPIKKPRGRPRKEASDVTQPKKTRGRPRKVPGMVKETKTKFKYYKKHPDKVLFNDDCPLDNQPLTDGNLANTKDNEATNFNNGQPTVSFQETPEQFLFKVMNGYYDADERLRIDAAKTLYNGQIRREQMKSARSGYGVGKKQILEEESKSIIDNPGQKESNGWGDLLNPLSSRVN